MSKKLVLLFIAIIVAFLGGITVGSYISNSPAAIPNQAPSEAKVSIMLDYGNGKVVTYDDLAVTKNENLTQLMQEVAVNNNITLKFQEYSGLGSLITQIGDKINGVGGYYWQYWVNNKMAMVGSSSYVARPGDIIEWKYIIPKQ